MTTDLLARIEADRQRYDREREANRARFPFAMELIDGCRAEGLAPKLRHAVNAAGEELGKPVDRPGIAVDGDKLAHLPAYEASWRDFYRRLPDTPADYRARQQRCIKPNARRVDEDQ